MRDARRERERRIERMKLTDETHDVTCEMISTSTSHPMTVSECWVQRTKWEGAQLKDGPDFPAE